MFSSLPIYILGPLTRQIFSGLVDHGLNAHVHSSSLILVIDVFFGFLDGYIVYILLVN